MTTDYSGKWSTLGSGWVKFGPDEPVKIETKWPKLVEEAPSGPAIFETCLSICIMLLKKNIAYGNSAIEPIGIFSEGSALEQIKVRIDDKLNRIRNAQSYPGDNDIDDLIGYLVLLKIAMNNEEEPASE